MKLQVVTAFFVAFSVVSFGHTVPKNLIEQANQKKVTPSAPPVIDHNGNDIVGVKDRKTAPGENVISLIEEQVKTGKIALSAKDKEAALEGLKTISIYTESLKDCKDISKLREAILNLFAGLNAKRDVQADLLDVLSALDVKAHGEVKAAAFNSAIVKIELAKFFKLIKIEGKASEKPSEESIQLVKQIKESAGVCVGKIKEEGITIPEAIRIQEGTPATVPAAPNAVKEAIKKRLAELQAELKKREDAAAAANQLHEQRRQELERTLEEQAKKQKEAIDALIADQNKKNDDLLKKLEDLEKERAKNKEEEKPEQKEKPQPQITPAPGASNQAPKIGQENPYNDPRNQMQQQQQQPMGPMMLPSTPSQTQQPVPLTLAPQSEADREARRARRDREDLQYSRSQAEVTNWLNNLMMQNMIAQQQMMLQPQRGAGSRFGNMGFGGNNMGRFGGAANMMGGQQFGQTRGSRFGNNFGGGIQQMGQFAPGF